MFAPGAGSLANCHFAINNVQEPATLEYDSCGLNRQSNASGVGAFTSFHGYHAPLMENSIPPGAEIFGSYSEQWFASRQEDLDNGLFGKGYKRISQGAIRQELQHFHRAAADMVHRHDKGATANVPERNDIPKGNGQDGIVR